MAKQPMVRRSNKCRQRLPISVIATEDGEELPALIVNEVVFLIIGIDIAIGIRFLVDGNAESQGVVPVFGDQDLG